MTDIRVSQGAGLVLRTNNAVDNKVSQGVGLVLRINNAVEARISQFGALVLQLSVDKARITQQTLEVLHQSTAKNARITQQTAEVLHQSTAKNARITQQAVEALYKPLVGLLQVTQETAEVITTGSTVPNAVRLTQQTSEVITSGSTVPDAVRLTQQVAEVIYIPTAVTGNLVVTQQYGEVFGNSGTNKAARVTQQYAEVLGKLPTVGVADAYRVSQQYAEVLLSTTPAARVTQQYAEILASIDTAAARVTQQYAEVITGPAGIPVGVSDGYRVTQQYAEIIVESRAGAYRATQQYSEVITGPTWTPPTPAINKARVTQQYAEVTVNGGVNDKVRLTQQYAELFSNRGQNVAVRLTQQYAEVILKRVFTTNPINDKDVFLKSESPRTVETTYRTDVNVSGDLSGTILNIPVATILDDINAAVSGTSAINILENSATAIQMNSSQLFRTGTGTAGLFIGSGGLFATNSSGVTTFSIDGETGAAEFAGDITGDANIDISGIARFNGTIDVPGSMTAAVWANESLNSRGGVAGLGSDIGGGLFGVGIYGEGANTEDAAGGYFISGGGGSPKRPALYAVARGGGDNPALHVQGAMSISSSLLVNNLNAEEWQGMTTTGVAASGATTTTQDLTNKPGTSTAANTWLQVTLTNGVDYVIPIWKKNV